MLVSPKPTLVVFHEHAATPIFARQTLLVLIKRPNWKDAISKIFRTGQLCHVINSTRLGDSQACPLFF